MARSIAVIVGSLRKEAFSRKMARALIEAAPEGLNPRFVEIGDLALYNDELEADVPPAWADFRAAIKAADAVLFVTPEYNRSVPGLLKNAIDVGSRPYGKNSWAKKPTAVVSTSPGALAAFGANHALRQSFVFLDMPVLQQPEAYIGQVHKLFDAEGRLINDDTKTFLAGFMRAFAAWIETHAAT